MKRTKTFKKLSLSIPLLIFLLNFSLITAQQALMKTAVHLYKDGEYAGQSQAIYKDEPYWGIAKIKIENGV